VIVTPSPAPPSRLFDRALRESLDGAMSPDRAAAVIGAALTLAELDEIPEEFGAFQHFVQNAMKTTLTAIAGPAASETCVERLSHVLWMASSTLRTMAPTPEELARELDTREDREEPSGLRPVEMTSARLPTPAPSAPPAREPTAPRRSPTLGRISIAQVRPPGVLEVSAPRSLAPVPVLVVSLDQTLARDLEAELGRHRPVTRIGSSAELVKQVTALRAQGFSVLIDAALPSVDLTTFAGLASLLPPGTRVVLWGSDERQKKRLVKVFPQANDWIASNDARTPGKLLTDPDAT
jgi:hypothetical protein